MYGIYKSINFKKVNYGNITETEMRHWNSQPETMALLRKIPIQNDQQRTFKETMAHGESVHNWNLLRGLRQSAEAQ